MRPPSPKVLESDSNKDYDVIEINNSASDEEDVELEVHR